MATLDPGDQVKILTPNDENLPQWYLGYVQSFDEERGGYHVVMADTGVQWLLPPAVLKRIPWMPGSNTWFQQITEAITRATKAGT